MPSMWGLRTDHSMHVESTMVHHGAAHAELAKNLDHRILQPCRSHLFLLDITIKSLI